MPLFLINKKTQTPLESKLRKCHLESQRAGKDREDILSPNNIVWYYSKHLGVCDEIHVCAFYICIVLYDCQSVFFKHGRIKDL